VQDYSHHPFGSFAATDTFRNQQSRERLLWKLSQTRTLAFNFGRRERITPSIIQESLFISHKFNATKITLAWTSFASHYIQFENEEQLNLVRNSGICVEGAVKFPYGAVEKFIWDLDYVHPWIMMETVAAAVAEFLDRKFNQILIVKRVIAESGRELKRVRVFIQGPKRKPPKKGLVFGSTHTNVALVNICWFCNDPFVVYKEPSCKHMPKREAIEANPVVIDPDMNRLKAVIASLSNLTGMVELQGMRLQKVKEYVEETDQLVKNEIFYQWRLLNKKTKEFKKRHGTKRQSDNEVE